MTLLEQLERELERVRKQLHQSTKELAVLTEQITRLRTGARPEVVSAALELALGIRLKLFVENGEVTRNGRQSETLTAHPAEVRDGPADLNGSPGLYHTLDIDDLRRAI